MRFWIITALVMLIGMGHIALRLAEMKPERSLRVYSLPNDIFTP